MWKNTTPVPNWVFDTYLKELNTGELKVLLVVTRQTLGWKDETAECKRKERDWISGSQLQAKTGSGRRTISCAIESLVKKGLIKVSDSRGCILDTPDKRKGVSRLFYQLSTTTYTVPACGKLKKKLLIIPSVIVKMTQDISKKVADLAQKKSITKVIGY